MNKIITLIVISCIALQTSGQVASIIDETLPDKIGVGTHASLAKSISSMLGIALRTNAPDVLKYKPASQIEYYNGSSWVPYDTDDWKNVLDGVDGNGWSIPYSQVRFTIDLQSTWIRPSAFLIGQDWQNGERSYNFSVESSNDRSTWASRLAPTFSGDSHTALNLFLIDQETRVDRYIRLTITSQANTSNPLYLKQVSAFTKRFGGLASNTSLPIYADYDRNIGIGTTTPRSILDVNSGTTGDAILTLEADTDNAGSETDNARIEMYQDGKLIGVKLGFNEDIATSANHFQFDMVRPGGIAENALTINPYNGKVGLGVLANSEDARLIVDGKIMAEEVKVQSVPASDYVFEPDYDLKPIEEVESFIKENKHLPDIPSAEEFKENGVGLGEMDDILLRKVEELMLYVIELKKENAVERGNLKSESRKNEELMEIVMELKRENEELKQKDKEIDELKAIMKVLIESK